MTTRNSESTNAGCGCFLLLMLIGAFGAIAYPLFFACRSNKSPSSEAKQYVGSMNRAQQAYFAEKSAFATSVDALGLGIKTETTNYKYSVRATKNAAFNYGISKKRELKSYVGGTFLIPTKPYQENVITTISILCSTDKPGIITPLPPRFENGVLVCGTGTTSVTK
ncbi:type IV pilin-like G/H family protein [Phormidium nigroviride]